MPPPLADAFEPDRPMHLPSPVFEDVTLVPWGATKPRGPVRAAGLFDRDGGHIAAAQCLRFWNGWITTPPEPAPGAGLDPVTDILPGTWLFGGLFYGHFGHQLLESTARLWAVDHCGPIDGLLFLPKLRLGHPAKMFKHHKAIFRVLGLDGLALQAPQQPVLVERVIVPEQGFGLGTMSAGRPQFRDFMRNRLSRIPPAAGPLRLYVSRSRLPSKRGSIVLETRIEALLAEAGYQIFHPQEHGLEEQIAHYRAAEAIVGPDGSALHLAAMVAEPDTRVAILNRGPSENIVDYIRQFRHFAGIDPLRVDAVTCFWYPAGQRIIKRETHALLDLPAMGRQLAAHGFLPPGQVWAMPSGAELEAEIAVLSARLGAALTRYGGHPADAADATDDRDDQDDTDA